MFRCDCPPYDCSRRVRSYLANNRQAGDELAEKFTPLVVRIVQRVMGPERRHEWEDGKQAIFLRLFSKLATWRGDCPFCKWLAVLAARRAIDLTRIRKEFDGLPTEQIIDEYSEPVPQETIECIQRKVAEFSVERRQVFEMMVQGLSRKEMSRRLGKSPRTIIYRVTEIRDLLRHCLED